MRWTIDWQTKNLIQTLSSVNQWIKVYWLLRLEGEEEANSGSIFPGNVWTDRNISWSEFNCSGWKLSQKLAAGVSGRSSCGNYNYFCPQNLWDKLDTWMASHRYGLAHVSGINNVQLFSRGEVSSNGFQIFPRGIFNITKFSLILNRIKMLMTFFLGKPFQIFPNTEGS